MSGAAVTYHEFRARERRNLLPHLMPPTIVVFCILFNFFLCFVNTNIAGINSSVIILCEIVLTGAAAVIGFVRIDRVKFFWVAVLGLQMILIAGLSGLKDEFMIKPLRDVMIMPIFVILGLSAYRLNFSRILLGISTFITLIALWEAFLTPNYLSLFNLRDFYITKGMMGSDENITQLAVFASGERPDGRFLFDMPGIHRISSVFLEPVSLGFYAMITGIYFIAAKDGISKKAYISGLLMSLFLIWLSDARMALGALTATYILRPAFARLDHRFGLLIFPIVMLFAYVLYITGMVQDGDAGLGARISSTMDVLSKTTLEIFLGVSGYERRSIVVDSGLAYLLNDQGFLGVLLYWLPPLLFLRKMPQPARIYIFGICIYLALGMMLSQAFFTIKTAALLWFCFGYLVARNLRDSEGKYHYPA